MNDFNDFKILKKISEIQPKNAFIDYIIDRIQDENYRGIHCSQHNRLTYKYVKNLLQTIYDKANDKQFNIHIGDFKNNKQVEAQVYYEIVDSVKQTEGKGTINSIKKTTFPDLARGGLLNRYDKRGNLVVENFSVGENKIQQKRNSIYSVKLSDLGLKFVRANNEFERIKIFSDFVDVLTQNIVSEMVELLSTNEDIIDVDILEFMYILSDDRSNIQYTDKLLYLTEYRKLTSIQKEKVTELLKQYCDPSRNKRGNKIASRDYSNWKNESQQIFGLFSVSTYFKVLGNKIFLNSGEFGLFSETAKRAQKPKTEYFKYHKISKKANYELHHIIPFNKATNKKEAQFIDDERNLIYLSSEKHKEFSNKQNINICTKYSNPNLLFLQKNNTDGFICVNIDTEEALISKDKISELIEYNEKLLKIFYP